MVLDNYIFEFVLCKVNSTFSPFPVGDRLLSVNDVSLENLSHDTVVEILQSTPDDVTLVVSQPKERLFPGNGCMLTFCKNEYKQCNRIALRKVFSEGLMTVP